MCILFKMTEHVKRQGSVRLPRRKVASAASVKSSFQVPFKIQSPGKVCKRDGKLCMFTHVYAIIFPGGACAVMALLLLAWTDFGKHVKFCFSPTGRETEAIVISNLMAQPPNDSRPPTWMVIPCGSRLAPYHLSLACSSPHRV